MSNSVATIDESNDLYETLKLLEKEGQLDNYLNLMGNNTTTTVSKKLKDATDTYKNLRDIEHLHELAEEIAPMVYSRCSLYLEVTIGEKKVHALVDTGAETNIISKELVDKLGLHEFIDRTQQGQVKGVGTLNSSGVIPYLEIKIDNVSCPLCFTVLDSIAQKDMIIGLPFMLFYQVKLDFEKRLQ